MKARGIIKPSDRLKIMSKNKIRIPDNAPTDTLVFYDGKLLTPNSIIGEGHYVIENRELILLFIPCVPDRIKLENLTLIDSLSGNRWLFNNEDLTWVVIE